MKKQEVKISLSSPISCLSGIGDAKAKAFARLGVFTLRDLIFHIPRAYEDRSVISLLQNVPHGEKATLLLTVATAPTSVRLKRSLTVTKLRAFDDSASVELTYFNQEFLKNVFCVGDTYRFSGRIERKGRRILMTNPQYEPYDPTLSLPDYIPVYKLSDGLSTAAIQKSCHQALALALPLLEDYLPEEIRRRNTLPTLQSALAELHSPTSLSNIRAAAKRLAFDELFLFSLRMQLSKRKVETKRALSILPVKRERFLSRLPYALTGAQTRSIDEIEADMQSGRPMGRILIGDVGSGKTVCAMYAVFLALSSAHQAAVMAPTEILATQHYAEMKPFFEQMGFKVALLLGSTSQKEKREIYEGLQATSEGRIDLVIGTHALLSDKTVFSDLALAVTDEQHRFGVLQRAALRSKAESAHLLVMSATPIPRTLALALYGDLSTSIIDELPLGRQRVDTFVVDSTFDARLVAFIDKLTAEGGQAYVVCPAIAEETEETEIPLSDLITEGSALPSLPLVSAEKKAEDLSSALPHLQVGLLHGKMKSAEKEAVMSAFAKGEIQVLVSTTVVEVGINVPNASLMLVENAERFGLAQLHQLRGRVGRGKRKSYCVLRSDAKGATAKQRLETMRTTYDGFRVAEEDLKLRGPGDFFSQAGSDEFRQSGGLAFRFASLCQDESLIYDAAKEAKALLSGDTAVFTEKHDALMAELERYGSESSGFIS